MTADVTIADHVVTPASISVNDSGSVYVADDGASKVYRYDPPYGSVSATVAAYGTPGGSGHVAGDNGQNGIFVVCAAGNNLLINPDNNNETASLNASLGPNPSNCRGAFDFNDYLWLTDANDNATYGGIGYYATSGALHATFDQPEAIDAYPHPILGQ